MLRSLKDMIGYEVLCPEGIAGTVDDFYFDNKQWRIRYLVVDISMLVPGKKVLITPGMFIDRPDWDSRSFAVGLSTQTVMNSPDIDTEKPVIRQTEVEVHNYFSQPYYWAALSYPSGSMPGIVIPGENGSETDMSPDEMEKGEHLHSLKDMMDYAVLARDSSDGKLDDIIIDDEQWVIDSLAASGKGYFQGKKYLVKPETVERVDHTQKIILLSLTSVQVKENRKYDPAEPVNVKMEERKYDYRGKPQDWNG